MRKWIKCTMIMAVVFASMNFCNIIFANAAEMTVLEENNPAISHVGAWNATGDGSASASRYEYSNEQNATATLDFTGTGIKWIATYSNWLGIAEVFLEV